MQEDAIKRHIIADPRRVLDDKNVLRALVNAQNGVEGRNIVDLRSVLVGRLEESLDQLTDTHRDVVAAAYENLSGTHQVHRAVLALIQAEDFSAFLTTIAKDLPDILGAEGLHVCLEGPATMAGQMLGPKGDLRHTIIGMPVGGVAAYCGGSRTSLTGTGVSGDGVTEKVILREVTRSASVVYGSKAPAMKSEAVIRLDLGKGRRAGMLTIGSYDAERFHKDKATDLLEFLGHALDAVLRRWLE